jgi:hypothetical protein
MSRLTGSARRRARLYALAFTVILMPSPAHYVLVQDSDPFFTAAIRLSDLSILALVALSVPELGGRARRPGILGSLAIALVTLLAIGALVHPATQGGLTIGRLVGAIAIAIAIADLGGEAERRFLLVVVALTAATQTGIALGELAYGGLLVAYAHDPVLLVGPFFRPNGTMPTAYVLAGFALVSASLFVARALRSTGRVRLVWAALTSFALIPVGITFSRAAAAGYVVAAGILTSGVLRRREGQLVLLAAFLAGGVLPALGTIEGWTARNADSPIAGSAVNRVATITQVLPLIAGEPFFGVGPGRTAAALREREARVPGSIVEVNSPHSVPVVIALEAGVPAGLVALGLIVALGLRARHAGTTALLCYVVLLPYLLADNWPYTSENGLIIVALWAAGSVDS